MTGRPPPIRVYYQPAGSDTEEHLDWDGRLYTSEAVAVRKYTGLHALDAVEALGTLDAAAVQAFVWFLRRFRCGQATLKVSDVDLDLLSVRTFELDADGQEVQDGPGLFRRSLTSLVAQLDNAGLGEAAVHVKAALESLGEDEPPGNLRAGPDAG